jgi:ABC-type nitrate/sulfonate/bicarbonate transport system substrate-binding protein
MIAHLPAIVARNNRAFEGVAIEFRVYGSSNDLLSALARNEVNVATTVALAPIVEREAAPLTTGGGPSVLIFSLSDTRKDDPFDGVFVRQDSPIQSLAELAGKRVGGFPGTTAKSTLSYLLQRDFGATHVPVWIPLPPNLQIEALASGDIDALYTYEPVRTRAELVGMRTLHGSVVAALLEGAPYGCSAVNRGFAQKYPSVTAAVVDGFDQGIRSIRASQAEAREALKRDLGLPEDVATRAHIERRLTSDELSLPQNVARFNKYLDILRAMGETRYAGSIDQLLYRR